MPIGCSRSLLPAGKGSPASRRFIGSPLEQRCRSGLDEVNQTRRVGASWPLYQRGTGSGGAPGTAGDPGTAVLDGEPTPHTRRTQQPVRTYAPVRARARPRTHARPPSSSPALPSPAGPPREAAGAAAPGVRGQPCPGPAASAPQEPEEVCEWQGDTQADQEKRGQLWKLATWAEGKGCIT